MKIKKIICIITVVAMICMMVACGGGVNNDVDDDIDGGGNTNTDTGNDRNDGNDGDDSGDIDESTDNNKDDGDGDDNNNSDVDAGSGGSNTGGSDGSDKGDGNNGESAQPALPEQTPAEILSRLVEDISSMGVDMPMSLPPTEVTADLSQNTVGLSEGDFNKLVASASYNMAAIGTFAHQIIVIKAKDASAATEVKKLVSGASGYDSKKWICVFPEKTIAVESGSYVLIVASYKAVVEAGIEAFKEITGSIGSVNTIWEFAE